MIKYFLHVSHETNSAVIGLIFDPEKKTFAIGGRTRFEDVMDDLINEFFLVGDESLDKRRDVERRRIQKNKIKFIIKDVTSAEGFRVLSEMRKAHLTLHRTSNFLNLMR